MSNSYIALEDSLLQIITSLEADRDPISRLSSARRLEAVSVEAFRKLKREAAYRARMDHSSVAISEMTEIDNKTIDYLVRSYLEANPHAPKPPGRRRILIDSFVDLSGE